MLWSVSCVVFFWFAGSLLDLQAGMVLRGGREGCINKMLINGGVDVYRKKGFLSVSGFFDTLTALSVKTAAARRRFKVIGWVRSSCGPFLKINMYEETRFQVCNFSTPFRSITKEWGRNILWMLSTRMFCGSAYPVSEGC